MEIPSDLFGLIREYSSPLYPKYLAQCEEALDVMKIYNWDELKAKLKTRHATKVMNSLMAMKEAYIARDEVFNKYNNCYKSVKYEDWSDERFMASCAAAAKLRPEMDAARKLYERRHLETMAAVFGDYYLTGPKYASLCE
jgi:hypothetical protein